MSKKWSEVIASPDYQSLNSQEKADAQSQYFNEVVKPKLNPDEVSEAHDQFYSQYPVGGQSTAQAKPTSQESSKDKSIFDYPIEAFGALGDALALGGMNILTGGQRPEGAAQGYYDRLSANPETVHNAEVVQHELPKQLAYGGAAIATEGLSVPLLETVGVSAPIASRVLGNVAGSIASQSVDGNGEISGGQIGLDALGGEFVHGSIKGLTNVGKAAYNTIREILPESIGGYSPVEKAANVANPEYINKVVQNDNPEAQYNYRMATSDESGNSILTPSQTMNTTGGKKYIAAEQRNLRRGSDSEYQNRFNTQQSGKSIVNAVENPLNPPSSTLQETAGNITDAFKQRSSQLYNDSKTQAQQILDNANINELKMNQTKQVSQQHLDSNAKVGNVNLTADAKRTLTQFNKAKIDNIDTLDQWKRTLSEKAYKAGKNGDYSSQNALMDTLNNLRNEADSTINSIDPNAGSLYRDADKYYSESVGDFSKKSILGKIASKDNPDTAGNILFNNQDARFNTQQIYRAMNNAMQKGNIPEAHKLSSDLADALGYESRIRALNAGNKGANFSNTRFANTLNSFNPQVNTARLLNNAAGMSISDQKAINQSLLDAIDTYRSSQPVKTPYHDAAATLAGKGIGGAIGTTLGSSIPVAGSTVGLLAGQHIGGKVADAINRGVFDEFMGTNKAGKDLIQFMADPVNAKAIQSEIDKRAANGLNTGDEDLKRIVRGAIVSTGVTSHDVNKERKHHNVTPNYTSPISTSAPSIDKEPSQNAQTSQRLNNIKTNQFDPNVTRLYRALSHAETGNLKDRFIRTRSAESGVSTAYGAAQLTTQTMDNFYQHHHNLFDTEEKDYIARFHNQGMKMHQASDGDPVYGYGGSGVLNSAADKKLYARVVRKMLSQMLKENGGDISKVIHQWRGNDRDTSYFRKVANAYRML